MNISVIIPVYNSISYIAQALQSIDRQTASVQEVICVDDASTDGTYDFIKREFPSVTLLKNDQNSGPSHSRNRGIKAAKGTLIAFLDADDEWIENKTKWQLKALRKNPSLEIIGGFTEYFQVSESGQRVSYPPIDKPHFNTYLGALLVKKEVFNRIGFFDERMRLSEDQDWFLKVREHEISLQIIEKVVMRYRVHSQNTTKALTFKDSGIMKAIKQSLDRRRQSGNFHELKKITK